MEEPLRFHVRTYDPNHQPNLSRVDEVVLKPGPNVRKIAKRIVVRNGQTGEHHHDDVAIECRDLRRLDTEPKNRVRLTGSEIDRLHDFLGAVRGDNAPDKAGAYFVLPAHGDEAELIRRLRDIGDAGKVDALAMLLRQSEARPELLASLIDRLAQDGNLLERTATAMNLAVCRGVVDRLETMIADPAVKEAGFQALLAEHPWLFGSGYSQVLERRRWTRDEIADFVPLRTSDGRCELVEIKTPLGGKSLFGYDASHKSYYAGPELSKAVGQVKKYLEILDRQRDTILANDKVDVTKIAAKVIIGRDGDADQQDALRRENGHMNRIEIMTYDGLLRIARRVIECLEAPPPEAVAAPSWDLDDDIPF